MLENSNLGRRPAESLTAQFLFSAARGGTSIAEAAMLREDPLLLRLIGLKNAADENTLNAWFAGQTETSVQALRKLNVELVRAALQDLIPARTGDATNAIDVVMRTKSWDLSKTRNPIFDTSLAGNQLCWRTLAVGPFFLDGIWSLDPDHTEHCAQFEALVTSHRAIWRDHKTYFSSGDVPEGTLWKRVVDSAKLASWTAELDRDRVYRGCNLDMDSPKLRWKEADSKDSFAQHYCCAYPGKDGQDIVPGVAVIARRKEAQDQFYQHRFLLVPPRMESSAQACFARHFSVQLAVDQMLDDLNLNRLIFLQGNAREASFAIASLAYNLLTALRLLLVPERHWTTREVIRSIITTPLTVSTSGRRDTGYLAVTPAWPAGWRELVESSMPGAGRRPPKR